MQSRWSAIFLSVVLVLLWTSPSVHASQHGTRWLHLDCSACLAVAHVLGERMNNSLKRGGSYLVSHRLDQQNALKRRDYRTGELRSVEVLDKLCDPSHYGYMMLRFDPLTKVRAYHKRTFEIMRDANRTALLEGIPHPSVTPEELQQIRERHDIGSLSTAKLYTAEEHDVLGDLYRQAPESFCVRVVDEFDDELSEIVKYANTLAEVEQQLCGLAPEKAAGEEGEGDDDKDDGDDVWKGLDEPISDVCADTAALQKSARMDQKRWARYQKAQQKRKERTDAEKTPEEIMNERIIKARNKLLHEVERPAARDLDEL